MIDDRLFCLSHGMDLQDGESAKNKETSIIDSSDDEGEPETNESTSDTNSTQKSLVIVNKVSASKVRILEKTDNTQMSLENEHDYCNSQLPVVSPISTMVSKASTSGSTAHSINLLRKTLALNKPEPARKPFCYNASTQTRELNISTFAGKDMLIFKADENAGSTSAYITVKWPSSIEFYLFPAFCHI